MKVKVESPLANWQARGHTQALRSLPAKAWGLAWPLNSGRLAQPCFWHFVSQRALEHLLGWEREGPTLGSGGKAVT